MLECLVVRRQEQKTNLSGARLAGDRRQEKVQPRTMGAVVARLAVVENPMSMW